MLKCYKNSYLSYFLMYNFYYLSWAVFSALISVYLLDKGFKASEVSLVVSTSFLTSMIFQPVIGMLSDCFDVKKVNFVLFGLAALGGLAFMFADSLIAIIIGYSFVLTLINGTTPVMEKNCFFITLSIWKDKNMGNNWLCDWIMACRNDLSMYFTIGHLCLFHYNNDSLYYWFTRNRNTR